MVHKTVLITGASAGIGRELSRVFAREGYDVILVARSRERLKELARELSETYGVEAIPITRDLSRPGCGSCAVLSRAQAAHRGRRIDKQRRYSVGW